MAGDRRAWLFFCTGVKHANHVAEVLRQHGIDAECLTGQTPGAERDQIVSDFKANRLRCMVGVSVFSTGFDHPGVDLIAMLRPTMSPGWYLQAAVRGCRPAYAKGMPLDTPEQRWAAMDAGPKPKGCLVLDFAGNVARHGPITAIEPPSKAKKGEGEAPTKTCPECQEIVTAQTKQCPTCGHVWESKPDQEKPLHLANDDIMGLEPQEMAVTGWAWRKHTSRTSGKEMLSCTFYGGLSDLAVTCYHCIAHEGYAGEKARREVATIAYKAGASLPDDNMAEMARLLNLAQHPAAIKYKRSGKFYEVKDRIWA